MNGTLDCFVGSPQKGRNPAASENRSVREPRVRESQAQTALLCKPVSHFFWCGCSSPSVPSCPMAENARRIGFGGFPKAVCFKFPGPSLSDGRNRLKNLDVENWYKMLEKRWIWMKNTWLDITTYWHIYKVGRSAPPLRLCWNDLHKSDDDDDDDEPKPTQKYIAIFWLRRNDAAIATQLVIFRAKNVPTAVWLATGTFATKTRRFAIAIFGVLRLCLYQNQGSLRHWRVSCLPQRKTYPNLRPPPIWKCLPNFYSRRIILCVIACVFCMPKRNSRRMNIELPHKKYLT